MGMKNELCYVSMNFAEEVDNFAGKEKEFEMPDKTVVKVENQLIRCPELMFKPELAGQELLGVHELVAKTVNACTLDVRESMMEHVVLSGGNTMYPNMQQRLQQELQNITPAATKVKVAAPPERLISVWIGGRILSSLSFFSKKWIQRESNPD